MSQSSVTELQKMYDSLLHLNLPWNIQLSGELHICKISTEACSSPIITHSIVVQRDLSWAVFIHGHKLSDTCTFSSIPHIDVSSLPGLMKVISEKSVCPGNADKHFLAMAESKSFSCGSKAYMEKSPVCTIRTTLCTLLVLEGHRCKACSEYRPQLRAMYSRWQKKNTSKSPKKFANNRYLSTPQRQKKLKILQSRAYNAEREVHRLKEKIKMSTQRKGVMLGKEFSDDLMQIMKESDSSIKKLFPEGSFRHLFWTQQLQATKAKDARQMRWHPCMIQWCLNLKLLSSSAYHSLRTSGFVRLPSERTLRDYTHFIKSKPGFYPDLDSYLREEAQLKKLPEWKRYAVIALDEMKLKESLVYDKHEAEVIGFVDIGDINNRLTKFERECCDDKQSLPIATHMLVLMVRGIFTGLRFPYAHFPTSNLTGEHLCSIVWEAVERLEHLGFKIIVISADGASTNRKFFRLHAEEAQSSPYNPLYKTENLYSSEKRELFFMSDVPHLLKTTRNNWSHSYGHGRTRKLWVSKLKKKLIMLLIECVF